MTTSRVASDLAAIMVPIGVVGAVLAVVCAVVAAVAIARGAGGLTGGAVGVWIPAAMVSSVAGFGSQWTPLIVSGSALVGLLVLGGVARAIVRATGATWLSRRAKTDAADGAAVGASSTVGTATSAIAVPSSLTRPNPVHAS